MFQVGKVYKRAFIHDRYGGNRQSGISPSRKGPYVFIFAGYGGEKYGYYDRWLNDVYLYTGEGQEGDMTFSKGNLALRDHHINSKRVFLFAFVRKGYAQFVSEMEVIDCEYNPTIDKNGKMRTGILFYLRRVDSEKNILPKEFKPIVEDTSTPYEIRKPEKTEGRATVKIRLAQRVFRKNLMHRWKYRCAVTGFNDTRILVASHIIPWKDATEEQRVDVENGLLLSPDYDALFDRHLISFEDNGKIILSDQIIVKKLELLGISNMGQIRGMSEGNRIYLSQHRSRLE